MALSVSPKGRLLQGNPFVASTTDYEGKPLTKADGTPTQEFYITVGFEKGVPENEAYIASIGADCARFWPAQFPQGVKGPAPSFGAIHPRFSSKVIDGDGLDGKGLPNSQKDGFANHWCVRYATAYAPSVYEAGKYDPMQNLALDPGKHSLLKKGYFVRVASTHETNGSDQTPGIKVYPSMIEVLHAGPEIVNGPDAGAVFGGAPTVRAAPPAAPGAPTPPTPPAAPAAPAGLTATGKDGQTIEGLRAAGWSDDQMVQGGYATRPAAPPAAPTPPAPPSPPTPPAPPAAPYSGYMQVDPDGPPAGFKMLPAAQGATYKSMTDAGWTQELLVQHGMVGPL